MMSIQKSIAAASITFVLAAWPAAALDPNTRISTAPGAGMEIEPRIPAGIAYGISPARAFRLFHRKVG